MHASYQIHLRVCQRVHVRHPMSPVQLDTQARIRSCIAHRWRVRLPYLIHGQRCAGGEGFIFGGTLGEENACRFSASVKVTRTGCGGGSVVFSRIVCHSACWAGFKVIKIMLRSKIGKSQKTSLKNLPLCPSLALRTTGAGFNRSGCSHAGRWFASSASSMMNVGSAITRALWALASALALGSLRSRHPARLPFVPWTAGRTTDVAACLQTLGLGLWPDCNFRAAWFFFGRAPFFSVAHGNLLQEFSEDANLPASALTSGDDLGSFYVLSRFAAMNCFLLSA